MSNDIQDTYKGRQMRIIPFEFDKKPCFTLVIEWFDESGKIYQDECRQMGATEFYRFAKSVKKAEKNSIKLLKGR